MKKIVSAVLCFVCMFCLVACGGEGSKAKSNDEFVVGAWVCKYESDAGTVNATINVYEGGTAKAEYFMIKTGETNNVSYTWEIKDNVINFTSEFLGSTTTKGYKISQENDTLTRVDGQEGTYTRKGEDVPAVADTIESSNKEPDMGIYTAQELATKKSDDYVGAVVSNYSPKNGCNVEWKIFYAGSIKSDSGDTLIGDRVYLIAGDYITYDDAPEGVVAKGTSEWEMHISLLDEYESSDDLTDEYARALSNKYLDKLASAPKHTNDRVAIRRALALMDTSKWIDFKDADGNAEFAMGGPTMELYVLAYNNVHRGALSAYASSTEGYLPSSEKLEKDGFFVINKEEKANGMWLASPADSQDNDESVIEVSYFGTMSGGKRNMQCGLRPIVCLGENVKLERQEDGTFLITK